MPMFWQHTHGLAAYQSCVCMAYAGVYRQVPLPPSPRPAWGGLGVPPTDIERFMSLATPLLPLKDPGQLKLVRMPASRSPTA